MGNESKKVDGQVVNVLIGHKAYKRLKILAAVSDIPANALIYSILEKKTEDLWAGYLKVVENE